MTHDPQSELPSDDAVPGNEDAQAPADDAAETEAAAESVEVNEAGAAAPQPAEPVEPAGDEPVAAEADAAAEVVGEVADEDDAEDDEDLAAAEAAWVDEDDEDPNEDVKPLEEVYEEEIDLDFNWYILKVQVNRERSIRDNLERRVKMNGMESLFQEILVPTEDVVEFTKSGKKRTVKKKLFPGYIMVNMAINDESEFLVRETSGIGGFTTSGGKPTPMDPSEVARIIRDPESEDGEEKGPVIDMPFKAGDRVRVKDGNFQNFEGEVESIDEAHGRVTVEIELFGRPTPVQLEHWQVENI